MYYCIYFKNLFFMSTLTAFTCLLNLSVIHNIEFPACHIIMWLMTNDSLYHPVDIIYLYIKFLVPRYKQKILDITSAFFIHKEKSDKMQQCIKMFIIPYLYEAQHVSGDTLPIIRSLKLHWQPLVFHKWKVVWTCSIWTLAGAACLPTSTNYTSNNLPRMKNQRMPVEF
jgi:hypothetical protein